MPCTPEKLMFAIEYEYKMNELLIFFKVFEQTRYYEFFFFRLKWKVSSLFILVLKFSVFMNPLDSHENLIEIFLKNVGYK